MTTGTVILPIKARAQDVSEVLDPAYLPTTPTEIALFQEEKKYLYSILKSNVETAKREGNHQKAQKYF
jgi:hypothetical protein